MRLLTTFAVLLAQRGSAPPQRPASAAAGAATCITSAAAVRLRDQVAGLVASADVDERARARDYGLRPMSADGVRIESRGAHCVRAARAYAALTPGAAPRRVAVVRAGPRLVVWDPTVRPGSEWTAARVFTRDLRDLGGFGM
jgi:hypothetical protein